MNSHRKILNIISNIRDSFPNAEHVFTHGSCMNLFCILRSIYPQAVAWFNIDHIITEIDGKFYDINGVVHPSPDYHPFTHYYSKRTLSKAFKEMYYYGLK